MTLWLTCSGQAAKGAATEYEESPTRENPGERDWLRQKARESQESFRTRVAVARLTPSSPSAGTVAASNDPTATQVSQSFANPATVPGQDLMLGALLFLAGLLAMSKLAPEKLVAIGAWLTQQGTSGAMEAKRSAENLDDERVFAEFVVAFKAGPTVARGTTPASTPQPAAQRADAESGNSLETEASPLRQSFAAMPPHVLAMRGLLQAAQREPVEMARRSLLADLAAQLGTLKKMAELPELLPVWQVTSALGGLVGQLASRAGNITPHRLSTVANGLDLLATLCQHGFAPDLATKPAIRFLAVDDDLLSRHAVAFSLKQAFNQPDVAANGDAALAQASLIAYDVVFLDVQMPRMNGFELCEKIRHTALNAKTPVVFVTCQSDLDARAKSTLCGGDDLIAKPFLTFEITVKALVLALRARIEKQKGHQPMFRNEKTAPATLGPR